MNCAVYLWGGVVIVAAELCRLSVVGGRRYIWGGGVARL